jgi:hypothetical protein
MNGWPMWIKVTAPLWFPVFLLVAFLYYLYQMVRHGKPNHH